MIFNNLPSDAHVWAYLASEALSKRLKNNIHADFISFSNIFAGPLWGLILTKNKNTITASKLQGNHSAMVRCLDRAQSLKGN